MSERQTVDFGGLFGAMWRVFAGNYGILLGFTIVLVVIGFTIAVVMNGIGLWMASNTEPGALGPVMIGISVSCALMVLVMYPVGAYIMYSIMRRARGTMEVRKPGRFGGIVALSIFQGVLIFPGQYILAAANPGQFSNIDGLVTMIEKLANTSDGSESTEARREQERSTVQEFQDSQIPVRPGLAALGYVVLLLGALLAILWFPWSFLALLDPRANASSAGSALAEARTMSVGMRPSLYGAYIVAILIMVGSVMMCCLPALFFGFPLILAAGPGFYMAMRGEMAN